MKDTSTGIFIESVVYKDVEKTVIVYFIVLIVLVDKTVDVNIDIDNHRIGTVVFVLTIINFDVNNLHFIRHVENVEVLPM